MKTVFPFILVLFIISCKVQEEILPETDVYNAIANTGTIVIGSYTYIDSAGSTISVKGDGSANELREATNPDYPNPPPFIDTLTSDFTLKWTEVPARFIAAGVFTEVPSTSTPDKNSINNTDDCVWLWYFGNGEGSKTSCTYSHGRSVSAIEDGEPVYEPVNTELEAGRLYYVILWAWNEDATKILYSSKVIRIVIKN